MKTIKLLFVVFSAFIFNLNSYSQSSVLSTGDWYKLSVKKEGIYCITKTDLIALGININSIDPRNLAIYGNRAGMLPVQNNVTHADDLKELAIVVKGESDGSFDAGDTLFFYGESSVQIKIDTINNRFYHVTNIYSDSVSYFLTIGSVPGKRIPIRASLLSFTNTTNKYTDYEYHEIDSVNLLHTGKKWFGESIAAQSSLAFNFDDTNISAIDTAYIHLESLERSLVANGNVNLFAFGISKNKTFNYVGSSVADPFGVQTTINNEIPSPFPSAIIRVDLNSTDTAALCWIDYLELNFTRILILYKSQQIFSDLRSVSQGAVTKFNVGNAPAALQIWDITDPLNVVEQQFTTSLSNAEFNVDNDSVRKFLAFDGQTYFTPVFTGQIPNQNLHALSQANMIIITDNRFHVEAQTLANFHQSHDNLNTIVADVDQIYNEYSTGVQDIVGIRDFIRQIFQRSAAANDSLKYLLLFGQASYDYRGRLGSFTSLIPTYETDGSINLTQSFNSDNFFGCMNDSASDKHSDISEIGIGRIPVRNQAEASVIHKIVNYSTTGTLGPWRKKLIAAADDGAYNTFLRQADTLMERIENQSCIWDINKIYFDSYFQDTTGPYPTYPDVTNDLKFCIENGSLIINYIGLGSEIDMSDERVLDIQYLQNVKNTNLPLFIENTELSNRFDDPSILSRGQVIALNDSGAGIGVISTGRLAFSSSNFNFQQVINRYLFSRYNNEYLRIGDIFKKAKQDYYSDPYIASMCLLGDPAVRLNYPKDDIVTTSINGHTPTGTDTLNPGQLLQIAGEIHDNTGSLIPSFNGTLYLTLFDQKTEHLTLGNDSGSIVTHFFEWDDTLYSDTALVINGMFNESFYLPWSLDSGIGIGKISFYAENGQSDASGCFNNFLCKNLNVGIEEINDAAVRYFPNPAFDQINFEITGIPVNNFAFTLFDSEGRIARKEIIHQNSFYIIKNFLASGFYFFEILDAKKQLIKRGKFIFE